MKWKVAITLIFTVLVYGQPSQTNKGPLTGMEFVQIPTGLFMMGSNDGDSDEKPVHCVTLSSFRMMIIEVTRSMWKEVMGNNPLHFKGDNLPVEMLSWDDV